MTLISLSRRNIKRSFRDYSVYFFTLILGIAIFYIFNAIGTQTAFLKVSDDTREIIGLLKQMLSGVSVFVAFVLAALVAYASRFLMKRRNKEFALYMLLGLGKTKIAKILLFETLWIGLVSLAVGLLVGVGLSQLMSAFVANMFNADMTDFTFTFSQTAFIKTIVYFAIIVLVVLVLEVAEVGKSRLIRLIQKDKYSEARKPLPLWLSALMFLLGVCILGFAYHMVLPGLERLDRVELSVVLLAGCVATFFIIYSMFGMILFIISKIKSQYYHGINMFTFRQITSRVNTMVISMTVICLMLFLTISGLSTCLNLKDSLNKNTDEIAPVDVCIRGTDEDSSDGYLSLENYIGLYDCELINEFSAYDSGYIYNVPNFTYTTFFGEAIDNVKEYYPALNYEAPEDFMRLSDYNALAKIYGLEQYTLEDDEYLMVCSFESMAAIRNAYLKYEPTYTIYGRELKPKVNACVNGYYEMNGSKTNLGVFVVPDTVIPEDAVPVRQYMAANYNATDKETIQKVNQRIDTLADQSAENVPSFDMLSITKTSIVNQNLGIGALIAFIGLYIGLVFLISGAAVLALKSMSGQLDSCNDYDTLRRIGVSERHIMHSLLLQEGSFFLMPLLLAILHAVVGIKSVQMIMDIFGSQITSASYITALIIIAIYGGYFVITYFSCKTIISKNNS